nr:hypothetical protein [Tanacetum cinerariifolium]
MHKAFPLLVRKFPLPEGTSHCLKMNATVRRIEMPLPEVCTAIEEKKKKLPENFLQFTLHFHFSIHKRKWIINIPQLLKYLDIGKFEQWQFRIHQYLQHEHYALWEVIEFGDSYKVPTNTDPDNTTTRKDDKQYRRTVTITTGDMQRKKNDVMARTTLLLSLPDEHQLRFRKYKTTKELWAAILKTFGEVEKDDLNQKFLTSLAPEWLMHTIVWRNRNDLDTMSLDDLYNHLKVYEAEVQKKSNSNSQNMAFISSSKNSSRNKDGNIACVSTSSTTVPTASASVATISQDTASAYIASQSNGSQIKFKDINQIDEDDMEEMDIKWSMALLSIRADKFWKRTEKKISIQGSYVAGFDKSKVECFNCYKMGHFPRECRAPRSQEKGRKENYRQGSKAEEKTPKALMAIDGVGWDWSYMANKGEDHALVANAKAPTEFALMANTESKIYDNSLCSNDCKKNNDSLNSKIKDLTGYNVVPPPAVDLYLSPKKDLSWTGLPEFVDDTVTDYSRPSSTIASTSAEGQNKDSSTSKDVASPNTPKPFVKFVKSKDSQSKSPEFVLNKKACFNCCDFSHPANDCRKMVQRDTTRSQKHAYESPPYRSDGHRPHGPYMRPSNRPPGHRPHGASMRPSHRPAGHRPHGPSMNPMRPNMNCARPNRSFFIHAHSYENRHFLKSSMATYPTFLILSHLMEDMCLLVKEDARLQAREPSKPED